MPLIKFSLNSLLKPLSPLHVTKNLGVEDGNFQVSKTFLISSIDILEQ